MILVTDVLLGFLCGICAYLLGAVPFGFLIARMRGVDIRTVGSGNIGATNVFRSVSKPLGILTFALDVLKGFCGVWFIPPVLAQWLGGSYYGMVLPLYCGVMAVAGHNWTCFLGFRGGKGIATSAGVLIGLSPIGIAIALGIWVITFITTRYVSVASIVAAVALGVAVWPLHLRGEGVWFAAALTLLALVAIWKHRSNIARLRAGTEARFTFGKRKKET